MAAAPGPVLAAVLALSWPGLQRADGISRLPAETSCSAGFSRVIDALPTWWCSIRGVRRVGPASGAA